DGTGQKIAVIGKSAFNLPDFQDFRSQFGLPKNDPKVVVVPGYPDPGFDDDEAFEASLDVQYAGAAAPNASIIYVYSPYAERSLQYAIDQNFAPVISDSYSVCEFSIQGRAGKAEQERSLAQQANAQGITWIANSGDTGGAGCEQQIVDKTGKS